MRSNKEDKRFNSRPASGEISDTYIKIFITVIPGRHSRTNFNAPFISFPHEPSDREPEYFYYVV